MFPDDRGGHPPDRNKASRSMLSGKLDAAAVQHGVLPEEFCGGVIERGHMD